MSRIQVLDSALANQIAAGEVVERPSSVIKELVENSIDADAHRIVVHIFDAGKTKMVVEDDGIGMDRDDSVLAFKRHATSKIKSTFDLFRIKTLGFRGEALPSISSVSHVTLITSTAEGVGTKIEISEDNMHIGDAPLRKGTIITVEDLFYNTPARLKYLKADYTENANSIEIMNKVALAHPEISFTLYIDEKLQFQTTGRGDLLEVIASLYGMEVARKMVTFEYKDTDFVVSGFIGRPELARANRYFMITLLNGRAVYMPKVQAAIQDSYHDFIPPTRYPFVVLRLEVDCALVDVNVHPSKREVRFSKEEELRSALLANIPSVLRASYKVVESISPVEKKNVILEEPKATQGTFDILFEEEPTSKQESVTMTNMTKEEHIPFVEQEKAASTFVYEEKKNIRKLSPYRAVAQLQKSYIIAEDNEGGFVLVDQHAAYERINYEKFQRILNSEIKVIEPLVPAVINLSPSDNVLFTEDKKNLLREIGLEFESFGGTTYKLTRIPTWLSESDEQAYADELVEQALHKDKISVQELRTHVIATMSCKASIKAHDFLNISEMQYVLDTLANCENPSCCPHGRPTIISFSKYQLEKLFKRTGV